MLIKAASRMVCLPAMPNVKKAGGGGITTTRGAGKKQALLDAGADYVVVTDEESLAERVMEMTDGAGANIVFDPVVGPMLSDLAEAAAKGATIYVYGALSPEPAEFPLLAALGKGLSIRGYVLFEITGDPASLEQAKRFVYDGLEAGDLKPIVARTFPLDDIVEAHRYMESNQQIGKIVVLT